jgi:heme/copper-type cytochrome/quinol oxidase subunit 2
VTVRPSRLVAALAGLTLTAGLSACAGTPAPAAEESTSAASTSSTEPSAPANSTGQRIEVQVAGGQVGGDTGRVPVASGEHVTLVITSDVADEVHVHGYDLEAELAPGQPTEIAFDATIPGVFEVELHEAGTLLLSLQVG